MGLFDKKPRVSNIFTNSYDDTEGLLLNLGVVSALMLSFVLGSLAAVQTEEFFVGDFIHLFLGNVNFRVYAYNVLKSQDFNFTVLGPDLSDDTFRSLAYINLEEIFVESESMGSSESSSDVYGCNFHVHLNNCNDQFMDYKIALPYIMNSFPQEQLTAYIIASGNEGSSGIVMSCLGWSSCTLTAALIMSMLFYVALAISSIREECERGNSAPIIAFNKRVVPMIILGFIVLFVGCCSFYAGLAWLMYLRDPYVEMAADFSTVYLYILLCPVVLLTVVYFVYVLWAIKTVIQEGKSEPKEGAELVAGDAENIDNGVVNGVCDAPPGTEEAVAHAQRKGRERDDQNAEESQNTSTKLDGTSAAASKHLLKPNGSAVVHPAVDLESMSDP